MYPIVSNPNMLGAKLTPELSVPSRKEAPRARGLPHSWNVIFIPTPLCESIPQYNYHHVTVSKYFVGFLTGEILMLELADYFG